MLTLSLKSPLQTFLRISYANRLPIFGKLLQQTNQLFKNLFTRYNMNSKYLTFLNTLTLNAGNLMQSSSIFTLKYVLGLQHQQIKTEDNILQINTFKRKKAKVKKSRRKQRRKKLRRLSEQKREKRNY